VRSFGRRVDPETGGLHARVHQAHDYDRVQLLRETRVGNGTIETLLITASSGPARRLVQLRAQYTEGGVGVDRVVQCKDELEEALQRRQLELDMLEAARKPSS
jgi:hypothetical protein